MAKRQRRPKEPKEQLITHLLPKTPAQAMLIRALNTSEQVFAVGPAGTGKTYVSTVHACNLYATGEISQIVITRPNVAAGRSLGAFPGTLEEKMAPWLLPIVEILNTCLTKNKVINDIKNGNIQIIPFETMRGLSFEEAFIILDEAQNTTPHEMKMFLTRQGEGSVSVISGDVEQSDIKGENGLVYAIETAIQHDIPASIVEFDIEDIVRSDISAAWIKAFRAKR